jgi:DNA-binding SARP family transcriptional activator/transcriptional regulator with XRE-family HTH domain
MGHRDDPAFPLKTLIGSYRREAKLTQQELAAEAGLSVAALRDYEQGRRIRLRPDSLAALVHALGLNVGQAADLAQAAAIPRRRPDPVSPSREGVGFASASGRDQGLWLAVLGPLEAWWDGTPLSLGPPARRAVLGLLVLDLGMLVRRDTIIDVLGIDTPPRTATGLVQAHVSRIRKLLEPGRHMAGDRVPNSVGGAYRLILSKNEVDLLVFRDLAARAVAVQASGDVMTAAELYDQAIGLWRGDPFADVDVLSDYPGVTALKQELAGVLLRYAEVACAVGQPHRVLPRLQAFADAEPLNEVAHARLMIALAGAGEQAAAIRVYEDMRLRLDRELGLYPGEELGEAHARVLRQDIRAGNGMRADALPPALTAAVPVVARQLPPVPRGFADHRGRRGAMTETVGSGAGPGLGAHAVAGRAAHGVVSRPRLFEQFATPVRVTVVSGPAGSGKTVLLRSWISHAGLAGRAAWVSVGQGERDPQQFWLSVLAALRQTAPASALVQPLTTAPDLNGWIIVERLLADLAPLREELWLVIDDVHELGTDQALRQLELMITRAPSALRLVLATRHDVQLGQHRLRLEGELAEIRGPDLRFSLAEARELFARNGIDLPVAMEVMLHERTEGWVTGLRLAALSLAGHPAPERFAAEFSGSERAVAEYLLAEVLDRQPEPVRRLLLCTSVLERVNGELADLLTGGSGGEQVLQDLEAKNAFVISLDAARSWFRYHQMFAGLLQLELRRTSPDQVTALRRTAADWLAKHSCPGEAVRYAQTLRDRDLAAQLLGDHWPGLFLQILSADFLKSRKRSGHGRERPYSATAVGRFPPTGCGHVSRGLVVTSVQPTQRRSRTSIA